MYQILWEPQPAPRLHRSVRSCKLFAGGGVLSLLTCKRTSRSAPNAVELGWLFELIDRRKELCEAGAPRTEIDPRPGRPTVCGTPSRIPKRKPPPVARLAGVEANDFNTKPPRAVK
jgi:hypothetical protein